MTDPISDREVSNILYRLRSHTNNSKGGPWIAEDCQEAADLIERLQRKIAQLEKAVEAAYAETATEQGE